MPELSHPVTQAEIAQLLDALEGQAQALGTRPEVVRHLRRELDERKRAEERYRLMGETIPFGVWWCNPQGEAEYVSPSFCELLDMTLEEQNKFGWTQRLMPEDVEPMMTKWLHCCRTGTPWDHEHRIIDRYGKVNTVLSRGLPVRDESGQIIAWVGVNLDITQRKRIELELKEAKEALEQAIHVKDQFLASISHELRTPLTLILGPVRKLLSTENLTDEQRHELGVVHRNARTLLKHVNDLLDLSKLDAGRMTVDHSETDLARLARFVASHFESVADDKQIRLTLEAPESLPAQVDPEKLQRVLFNLLSNAVKFTPRGGVVRFSLMAPEGKAVFVVEDTGPGIPPEMRETVFERFRQVDSSATRRHGGTGLGLAIAKEFVGLHRGTIRVDEASDGGARFVVEIPRAAPDGVDVRAAPTTMDEEGAAGAVADLRTQVDLPSQPKTSLPENAPLVLVVEDNPEMNAFIAQTLRATSQVTTAFDGQEGLEKAVALQPDLIISDIMMPRMSGEDLVREVRRHRELDDIPILLLTAKADENLRVRLLSGGAQDCLVKPFVAEELVARATGLVARKRKAEASLRASHALLQAVTEGVSDAIFVKDVEGRYLMINNPGARRLGQASAAEVLGRNDAALFDAETAAQARTIDRQVMAAGQTRTFEETRRMDSETRTYLTTKGPYRDHEGRVVGVLGISRDITDRKRAEEALQQATTEAQRRAAEAEEGRRILQAMMEHIPMGITIADAPEVHIRAVSRYGQALTGRRPEQIEGIPVEQHTERWQIYCADGVTPARNEDLPLTRATQHGEVVKEEEWVIAQPDGTKVPILCTAAPIRDVQGQITGGVIGWQDITDRKRAEEELRRTTILLRAIVESTPDLIFVKDRYSRMLLANPATLRTIGKTSEQVLGKSDAEWGDDPREANLVMANDRQVMDSGQTQVVEEVFTGPEGTHIYLSTKSPLRDEQGQIVGTIGLARDITERKRAAEALRESEERFRAFMDNSPTIAWAKDEEGRHVYLNRTYERRFDVRLDDWRGKTDFELWPAEIAETFRRNDLVVLRSGQAVEAVEETPDCDGGHCSWWNFKFPFQDASGRSYIGGMGIDITDRKRAEEELRRLKDELELRVEQRTAELAAANRELEAFAFTVSHDLRAPLRHILGFIELLDEDVGPSLDEERREYLRIISNAAQRMGKLIDDLLTLSRLGRVAIAQTRVDLGQLVGEVRQELAPETAGRAIEWQIGTLPVVRGDPTLLRNVMVNLLANAIKYTRFKDPGRIEVGSWEETDEVVCFVRDNGAGFDMRFADKLFGVFQRLHPAGQFEGTGVGLASVRRIIERHGGRVWAEGEVDRGATFYFALPRSRSS